MNVELLISKNIINAIYSNYSRTLMGVPEYTDRVIQLKQDLNTIGIGFIYDFYGHYFHECAAIRYNSFEISQENWFPDFERFFSYFCQSSHGNAGTERSL